MSQMALVLLFVLMFCPAAEGKQRKRLVVEGPVSAETCQQIREAVATYGVAVVEAGAASRGFTQAQITQARAYCK